MCFAWLKTNNYPRDHCIPALGVSVSVSTSLSASVSASVSVWVIPDTLIIRW